MENTDPHASGESTAAADVELDLAERIAALENQLGAVRDEQLRERAELDNQRKRLVREGVSCFRAYDADIPEYAAAIDVYHAIGIDDLRGAASGTRARTREARACL